jgi:hypothetical protein
MASDLAKTKIRYKLIQCLLPQVVALAIVPAVFFFPLHTSQLQAWKQHI